MNCQIVSAAFCLLVFLPGGSAQGQGPQDVLERCIDLQSKSHQIRYSAVVELRGGQSVESNRFRSEVVFVRSGGLVSAESLTSPVGSGEQQFSLSRLALGRQYKVAYQLNGTKEEVRSSEPNGGVVWEVGLESERSRLFSHMFLYGAWLDGYLAAGDKSVAEAMLGSESLSIASQSGADDTLQLTASTRFGDLSLWVDPLKGYVARKITVVKRPQDLIAGSKLADLAVDPRMNSSGYESWRAEAFMEEFQQIEGVWVATKGTLEQTDFYTGGKQQSSHYTVVRSDIKLSPSMSDEDFRSDLPVGAAVNFVDEADSGISYAWDGDSPVKASLLSPAEPRFSPVGNLGMRIVLMVGGLVAVALLVLGASWLKTGKSDVS
ncbi:hypothetical protein FF011L_04150 [Roseimaritima multifibrata]|uniref:Uncharacterized protein n=1 Tax=Roseimaritima multifibrata TaxID=1930274 RepID=A0A517M9W6_9BACT|nr:hypothetical protein FF011L_04150 [Roseimaritima multifibrata]